MIFFFVYLLLSSLSLPALVLLLLSAGVVGLGVVAVLRLIRAEVLGLVFPSLKREKKKGKEEVNLIL